MPKSAGLKANGRLKKGYKFKKGGGVVKVGRSPSTTGRKRGARRRRRSSGGSGFLLF